MDNTLLECTLLNTIFKLTKNLSENRNQDKDVLIKNISNFIKEYHDNGYYLSLNKDNIAGNTFRELDLEKSIKFISDIQYDDDVRSFIHTISKLLDSNLDIFYQLRILLFTYVGEKIVKNVITDTVENIFQDNMCNYVKYANIGIFNVILLGSVKVDYERDFKNIRESQAHLYKRSSSILLGLTRNLFNRLDVPSSNLLKISNDLKDFIQKQKSINHNHYMVTMKKYLFISTELSIMVYYETVFDAYI